MNPGLKPLEYVWLICALLVLGQQVFVRHGEFDPVALAAIAFFVGMIPAGRADRKKNDGRQEGDPNISEAMQDIVRKYLERTKP